MGACEFLGSNTCGLCLLGSTDRKLLDYCAKGARQGGAEGGGAEQSVAGVRTLTAAGSLRLLCICVCFMLQNKQRASLGDRLADVWAGPRGGRGRTNIGRPCMFRSWLILEGVQGDTPGLKR